MHPDSASVGPANAVRARRSSSLFDGRTAMRTLSMIKLIYLLGSEQAQTAEGRFQMQESDSLANNVSNEHSEWRGGGALG